MPDPTPTPRPPSVETSRESVSRDRESVPLKSVEIKKSDETRRMYDGGTQESNVSASVVRTSRKAKKKNPQWITDDNWSLGSKIGSGKFFLYIGKRLVI